MPPPPASHPLPDAWDCHAHLFGPYARFPLAPDRSYTPPPATIEAYDAMLGGLGLARGVLVHPSAYGDDFSLLFEALERRPAWRGVAVLREADAATLKALRARGVRALRFSHRSGAGANFAGSASFDDLLALAAGMADAGLHAELWTDCASLPALAPRIAGLPVAVVFDHMGGFDATQSIDEPGFAALRGLLERGPAWVKLCAYRSLAGRSDATAGRAHHRALIESQPERVVWGTDWPHLRVDPVPDTAALLRTMIDWTADDEQVARILRSNPARLYA
ncbi:MAG: amidohydrolase family protein [Lautropia sp.]